MPLSGFDGGTAQQCLHPVLILKGLLVVFRKMPKISPNTVAASDGGCIC